MKVLLDTNVLLDYLLSRNPGQDDAITLLQLGNIGHLELLVTDLTIANIAYITRKDISREMFYSVMHQLCKYFTIIPIGQEVVQNALREQWADFEDCLQNYAASQAGASHIITRNTKDFVLSSLMVTTPSDFIDSL